MDAAPFMGLTSEKYPGVYDAAKVKIIGWEYSVDNVMIHFSPEMPTHAVWWIRPVFGDV